APTTLSARVTAPRSAAIYTRSLHDALPIYRVFRPLIIDIRPQRNIVGSDREQSLVFLPRTCHLHLESASFDEPTGVAKMPCSHVVGVIGDPWPTHRFCLAERTRGTIWSMRASYPSSMRSRVNSIALCRTASRSIFAALSTAAARAAGSVPSASAPPLVPMISPIAPDGRAATGVMLAIASSVVNPK